MIIGIHPLLRRSDCSRTRAEQERDSRGVSGAHCGLRGLFIACRKVEVDTVGAPHADMRSLIRGLILWFVGWLVGMVTGAARNQGERKQERQRYSRLRTGAEAGRAAQRRGQTGVGVRAVICGRSYCSTVMY